MMYNYILKDMAIVHRMGTGSKNEIQRDYDDMDRRREIDALRKYFGAGLTELIMGWSVEGLKMGTIKC